MKKTIAFVGAAALFFACCNNPSSTTETKKTDSATAQPMDTSFHSIDTTKLAMGTVFYQCPMHPEIISDKPGTCPKCKMEFEKHQKI